MASSTPATASTTNKKEAPTTTPAPQPSGSVNEQQTHDTNETPESNEPDETYEAPEYEPSGPGLPLRARPSWRLMTAEQKECFERKVEDASTKVPDSDWWMPERACGIPWCEFRLCEGKRERRRMRNAHTAMERERTNKEEARMWK